MEEDRTTLFVIDPPPDDPDTPRQPPKEPEGPSERLGPKSWRIDDEGAFAKRNWEAQSSSILKWIGQYKQAAARDHELEPWRESRREIPNDAALERKATDIGTFIGIRTTLFPELGNTGLRVFTGVDQELFARIEERTEIAREGAMERQLHLQRELQGRRQQSPFESLSADGSCMIIEGL